MRGAHHYALLRGPRLRKDLYCVEWDVKLYYTIPVHVLKITIYSITLHSTTPEDVYTFQQVCDPSHRSGETVQLLSLNELLRSSLSDVSAIKQPWTKPDKLINCLGKSRDRVYRSYIRDSEHLKLRLLALCGVVLSKASTVKPLDYGDHACWCQKSVLLFCH